MVKGVFLAFCAFLFVFAPFDYRSFFKSVSKVRGDETISGTVHWSGDKLVTGQVVVPGDATLIIDRGTTVSFASGANILVHGTLEVKGTVKNKVIFQGKDGEKTGYVVGIAGGTADIRNADISGGGGSYGFGAFSMIHRTPLLRVEAMHMAPPPMRYGAVYCNSVCHLNIEGARFHDNDVAISMLSPDVFSQVFVNRSRFIDNGFDVDGAGGTGDFRYDWWGNTNGPQKICGGCADYDKIAGNIDFSDFATTEYFRDPVIVIPGILGSKEKDGKLVFDPIFHTYDNLVKGLQKNGYSADSTLFALPYNWRDSNVETAKLLKAKIAEVKTKERWPKVDIVAHSMGGLVAREYIEGNEYQGDIDQLITLGTPNNGAPEGYVMWEGGEAMDATGVILKLFLHQEVAEGGYDSLFDYVQNRPVTSIRELLPVYDYLYDIDSDLALRKYPDNYPKNTFLENLNVSGKVERLKPVEYEKVVGKVTSDDSTRTGFEVTNTDMGKMWTNGYPPLFGLPFIREKHIRRGFGDGTVPLESAQSENVPADYSIVLNATHLDLPTAAQKEVVTFLTGNTPSEVYGDGAVDNLLAFQVFSPIDIEVISPSGKRVGKNFDTSGTYDEIPGAYYTGSDAESEFITIPNPEKGEYRILTQGTGTGSYRIEASDIVSGVDGSATESVATFHGDTTPGATGDFSATVSDSGVQDSSTLKIVEVPTGTTSSDATMGSSDNSSSSHHAKKSSGKKPAVVIATATTTENEVRPTLATNLFPNPNPETGADSGASDTTIREQGKTVSETAGDARDAGISWWHVILSIISLLIVVTLAKLAWASRKRKQADQSRTVLD